MAVIVWHPLLIKTILAAILRTYGLSEWSHKSIRTKLVFSPPSFRNRNLDRKYFIVDFREIDFHQFRQRNRWTQTLYLLLGFTPYYFGSPKFLSVTLIRWWVGGVNLSVFLYTNLDLSRQPFVEGINRVEYNNFIGLLSIKIHVPLEIILCIVTQLRQQPYSSLNDKRVYVLQLFSY